MHCFHCGEHFKPKRTDQKFCNAAHRIAAHRSLTRFKHVTRETYDNRRTILSLCDYSGTWSEPYARAGYDVIRVDIKKGRDVRLLKYPGKVYGLLAAPPVLICLLAGRVNGRGKAKKPCWKVYR